MLVRASDGRLFRVDDGTPEEEIRQRLALVEPRVAPVKQEEQGFLGRAGDLLELGGRELLASGSQGIATLADMTLGDRSDSFERGLESFASDVREGGSDIEGIKPLQEAEGVGDALSSAASYLVQSVPEMATVFAGAGAGQLLIPIPVVGALIGGTVAGVVPFLGRNTEEFKQVNGRAPTAEEGAKLLATATVQSGLNTIITRLVPFKGSPRLTPNVVKKAAAGTVLEGSTEGLQDALQILSANNFDPAALGSDDAVYRLTEAVLAGGAVGGGIGVATAPFTRARQTPETDPELTQAARDFAEGREGPVQGPPAPENLPTQPPAPQPEQPDQVETQGELPLSEPQTIIDEPMGAGVRRTLAGTPETDDRAGLNAFLGGIGAEASIVRNPDKTINEEATAARKARYDAAVEFLDGRLEALSQRGEQGAEIAGKIRSQVLENAELGATEIEGAFLAADALTETLGGKGPENVIEVNFMDTLTNEQGDPLSGLKQYKNTSDGKLKAVIDLAFGEIDTNGVYRPDAPKFVAGTASHEAFHVLQDFYAKHSPSDAKILKAVYKTKDGKVNYKALPGSIRRLWKEHGGTLPGSTETVHQAALKGTLPESIMSSPAEFQAMTFEFYKRAKQAGDASPLTGSYGKFFDFVYNFLPRLANGLRGRGFQTVEDVFTRAGRGRTGQQLQGRALSPRPEALGTAEESRVMPIRRDNEFMQKKMSVPEVGPGGNFMSFTGDTFPEMQGLDDLTGQTFSAATISIDPQTGKPNMEVSDVPAALASQEDFGKEKFGRAINLINPNKNTKKRQQWKWADRDNETDPIHTIVSVTTTNNLSSENGGRSKIQTPSGEHLFAMQVDMDGPTKLSTFPDGPSEPRLRPVMYAEDIELGPVFGTILMRGKEKPLYEYIRLTKRDQSMTEEAAEQTGSFKDRLFKSANKVLKGKGAEQSLRQSIAAATPKLKEFYPEFEEGRNRMVRYKSTITTPLKFKFPRSDSLIGSYLFGEIHHVQMRGKLLTEVADWFVRTQVPFFEKGLFNAGVGTPFGDISVADMVTMVDPDGEALVAEIREQQEKFGLSNADQERYAYRLASYFEQKLDNDDLDLRTYSNPILGADVVVIGFPRRPDTMEEPDVAFVRTYDNQGRPEFLFHEEEDAINAFRLDNELRNFFPDLEGETVKTEQPFFFNMAYDQSSNDWEVSFTVNGTVTTRENTSPKGTFEIFGNVLASMRKALDVLKDPDSPQSQAGFTLASGIVFQGTDPKKHDTYIKLFSNPVVREMFPEFEPEKAVHEDVQLTKIPLKDKFKQKDLSEDVVEDDNEADTTGLFTDEDFNAFEDDGFDVSTLIPEASLRLNRVADISQVRPNPENDSVAQTFGLDPRARALSALDILYNRGFDPQIPERDTEAGDDGKKRPKGRNVNEAGLMLHNKALAILGRPILSPDPDTDRMLAQVIAAEAAAAMRANPDGSALDWYTTSVERAIDEVAKIYPEVRTDPEHRNAFAIALALTSQGIKVDRNSAIGLGTYEFWRDNGRFPEFGEGTAAPAIATNFKFANILQKAFDKPGRNFRFRDFLQSQYTKRDLIEALNAVGIPTEGKGAISLAGENMDTLVYGSFVFGPKIGQGFYQNLMGNFEPVTIDLWFMRTWGRLTGTLIGNESATQKNIDELRALMPEEGIEFDPELFGTDIQYTMSLATRINKAGEDHFKAETKRLKAENLTKEDRIPKSKAQMVAKNLLVNAVETQKTPDGGSQRVWIRSVVNMAREMLAEKGINISNADLQAVMWYPEKDIYDRLMKNGNGAARLNLSYEDSFGVLADEEVGIRSVDGAKGFDDIRASIREADAESRRQASGTRGQEASIRLAGDYRTTEGMRAVIADPTARTISGQVYSFSRKMLDPTFRKGFREKLVNEFVHGLAPIARRELALSERTRGVKRYLPFAESAFKITEIAQQLPGKMEMFYRHGAPQLNADGTVTIADGTRGLKEIFEPIGQSEKYGKFQMFVYAQRAQRLKREGRENLLTDAQIAEGMRYGSENPEFAEVFRQYQLFNDKLMQFLVDTGSIDQATKQRLMGTTDYVPFYRVIEEEQYTEGLFGQVKKASQFAQNTTSAFDNPDARIKEVLRKLKGGEERIGDLYENIFANTQAIVSAGMRNVAAQRTVKMIEELKRTGYYKDASPDVIEPRRITQTEAKNNSNHFTLRENGKTVFYDVGSDGELITAMRTFTPLQMQGLLKAMQNMGRFFRNMITITPGFMTANLIRGDLAGVVTVDAPLRPMIDTLTGLKNALTDAETVQEMKTIGGFGGYTFGDNNQTFAKKMKRHYRRHEGYTIVDTPQKMYDLIGGAIDKVNQLGEATEMATREAIFRRMTEAGASKGDAAFEALNLINYSRRGNPQGGAAQTLAMLLPLVPFLNARIQGLYRTGTAFNGESNATGTLIKGMTLMGLSLALYALSSQEDEWDNEPLHRKLNYYIIYAGDKKYLIPKPFEIGAMFSTLPEVFLDGIKQKDGEYVRDAVLQVLMNNFSFNPIPQAIKPLVEVGTNYDFFRAREMESLGVRGLPTEQRSYSTTSEFAKMMGDITSTMGISPIEAEALVNGYAGSMGGMVLAGVDSLLGTFGVVPKKPAGVFGDSITSKAASSLGITRFVKDRGADPANRFISEFYEMKREADEINRGINRLREEGNYEAAMEMRRENRSLLGVRKQLNRKYQQLNEINDRIAGVKSSGLSPEQKQSRIDQLIKQRNRVVSDMTRLKKRIRGD